MSSNGFSILIAEDDLDDRQFIRDAFEEAHINSSLSFVSDGEELLCYLLRKDQYVDARESPTPSLILLDLNMPRKDGREALAEIKANPSLRGIPIVVLTTSNAEEDIIQTYNLGVNSFITKPPDFRELVRIVAELEKYWFGTVELPSFKEATWS